MQIAQGRSVYQICVFTVHQKMQLFPLARFCSKFAVIFPWWSTFRLNYSSPGHKHNSKLSTKTLVNNYSAYKFSSKGNFLVTNFYHCFDTNQNKITPNTMVARSCMMHMNITIKYEWPWWKISVQSFMIALCIIIQFTGQVSSLSSNISN